MRRIGEFSLEGEAEEAARDRYSIKIKIVGRGRWSEFVETLESDGDSLSAFDAFLTGTTALRRRQPVRRLFISHKRARRDTRYAERIARLATAVGLPYWLDVHDPVLLRTNGQPFAGPQRSLLIAAHIEMALLNCTSVMAVHSRFSGTSKWIPYEFGRVKAHVPLSRDAAGYYDPIARTAKPGEYFELAVKTYGEGNPPPRLPNGAWQSATDWLTEVARRSRHLPRHAAAAFPAPAAGEPPTLP